jgi:hypothetical protein
LQYAVVLVKFPDLKTSPTDPTADTLSTLLNGQVSNFFKENSYHQLDLDFNVINHQFTLPQKSSYYLDPNGHDCNLDKIWADAFRISQNKIDYSTTIGLIVHFPGSRLCPKGIIAKGNTQQGLFAITTQSAADDYSSYAHEIGHNFGLNHSSGLDCGPKNSDYSLENCFSTEFGDPTSAMSYVRPSGHFHALDKETLGWTTGIQTASVSGTYLIHPLETTATGTVALKIPIPNSSDYYVIENRTAFGFDKIIPASFLSGGVLYYQTASLWLGSHLHLVDLTPNSQPDDDTKDFSDGGLALGTIFDDTSRHIRLTPLSKINGDLIIDVSYF